MNWLAIKHYLMNALRWITGLLGIISLYLLATRSRRMEKKADRAGAKYFETSSDTINLRWKDAGKYQKQHEKAQAKAKTAKETARMVRDAVASENSTLDDLFDSYQSKRRVPADQDAT